MVKFYAVKTIALENVDFFQRERICLEKHKQSDSMSRVVVILLLFHRAGFNTQY